MHGPKPTFDFVQPTSPRQPAPCRGIRASKDRDRIKLGVVGLRKTRAPLASETPRQTVRDVRPVVEPASPRSLPNIEKRRKSATTPRGEKKPAQRLEEAPCNNPDCPVARPGTCPTIDLKRKPTGRLVQPCSDSASPTHRHLYDRQHSDRHHSDMSTTADMVSPASMSPRRGSDTTPNHADDASSRRDGKLVAKSAASSSKAPAERQRSAGGPVTGWEASSNPVDIYEERLWEQEFCAYAAAEWARVMNEKNPRSRTTADSVS